MTFNPEQFLNTEIQGATSTEYVPVPEGEWDAVCQDVNIRTVKMKDGGVAYALSTNWHIIDPQCKELMGIDRDPPCKYDVFLDLDESGNLKSGKGENVKLGLLREACGLNDPNKPFMMRMFQGQPAKLKTSIRLGDGGEQYTDVKAVSAAA